MADGREVTTAIVIVVDSAHTGTAFLACAGQSAFLLRHHKAAELILPVDS
jgi:hypothetical protein